MAVTREILTARLEDGTYLAVSPKTPRFCVGGQTREEAIEKAKAAFNFSESYTPPRPDRAGKPITVYQPDFKLEELVA